MSGHALVGAHRGSNPNTAHPVGKHACVQAAAPAQQAAHARQKHTHGAGQRWSPKWWGNNEKVPNQKRPYSTVQIKLMVCVEKVSTCWKGKKTGFRRRPPRKNEFIGISIWSCTAHINRWAIKKKNRSFAKQLKSVAAAYHAPLKGNTPKTLQASFGKTSFNPLSTFASSLDYLFLCGSTTQKQLREYRTTLPRGHRVLKATPLGKL